MSNETETPHTTCEVCGRPLPKGRVCTACRVRKCRGALIAGEACAVCQASDPRILRWHRLADGLQALCANHAAIAGRRRLTLAELILEEQAWEAVG